MDVGAPSFLYDSAQQPGSRCSDGLTMLEKWNRIWQTDALIYSTIVEYTLALPAIHLGINFVKSQMATVQAGILTQVTASSETLKGISTLEGRELVEQPRILSLSSIAKNDLSLQ